MECIGLLFPEEGTPPSKPSAPHPSSWALFCGNALKVDAQTFLLASGRGLVNGERTSHWTGNRGWPLLGDHAHK